MSDIKKFFKEWGWFGLIRLMFYPVTTLFTTPVRLFQTLWNCRILIKGNWIDYPHFNVIAGLNTLFYWSQAINYYRFGRKGKSPYLGLGNYNLARGFHYSLVSLYLFWKAAMISLFAGAFGWLFLYFLWINFVDLKWMAIVLCLALFSTLFYAHAFKSQNYNTLGWLFFPAVIFGMLTKSWIITSIALFLVSFGSFTAVFISCLFLLLLALSEFTILPVLAALPACIKLLTHFHPFLSMRIDDTKKILSGVLKAIGASRKKTKYKRKIKGKKLGVEQIYFLALNIQFVLVFYWLSSEVPFLMIAGIGIYLMNVMLKRFADEESMYMMTFTLAVTYTLSADSAILLISYWFLISPLPLLIGFNYDKTILDIVPEYAPFSMKKHLYDMERFFLPVNKNERVLLAFNDPKDKYENIFDGYRQLIELPRYIATKKEVHFMPDWWGVFELNYEGAPDFWGRSVESVKENINYWNLDFVITYQNDDKNIDPKWENSGFEVLTKFDWSALSDDFKNHKKINVDNLTWWLLKYNNNKKPAH